MKRRHTRKPVAALPRIDTAGIRNQVMMLLLDVAPEIMMAVDAVLVRELPA